MTTFVNEQPRADYKADAIHGVDGNLIATLKKVRPCPRKTALGQLNRRILHEKTFTKGTGEVNSKGQHVVATYERSYHATKGWRTRRVGA